LLSRWVVAAIIFISVCSLQALSQVLPAEEFAQANKYYERKDYDSAIQSYSAVLKQGKESASLYYNLGNAYFKKGDLGHAILYYMRAKRLDPSDEDIAQNLAFAKQFSRLRMEGVELNPINTFMISQVDPYRLTALAWVSSTFFILFILLLIFRFGLGIINPLVRIATIVTLVLLIVSVGLTTFKYRNDFLTQRGVIVAEEAPVQTGPTEQSDIELQGAPGLIVEIIGETSNYYNVLFENKRRGWIKKDLIAEI